MSRDARDRAAQVFEEHGPRLRRYLRKHALCPADADDALQAAFLSILESIDIAKIANLQAYLFMTALRKLSEISKKEMNQSAMRAAQPPRTPDLDPDVLLNRLHFERVLTEDLNRLPEAHRRVLILRCRGLSYEEIASECSLKKHDVERILIDAWMAMQPTSQRL